MRFENIWWMASRSAFTCASGAAVFDRQVRLRTSAATPRKLSSASCSNSSVLTLLDVEPLFARFDARQGQQIFGEA